MLCVPVATGRLAAGERCDALRSTTMSATAVREAGVVGCALYNQLTG
jgi:hypothetical protein